MTMTEFDPATDRAAAIEEFAVASDGEVLIPVPADFDLAGLTPENYGQHLRPELPDDDLSRAVVMTRDWPATDRRVTMHNHVWLSWLAEDGSGFVHRHVQGATEEATFIMEDLDRAAAGGDVRYRPPRKPKPETKPEPANANEPLPLINPADLVGREVPEREWYLHGLIPSRQVTLLSGDGGTGKTLLGLQIAAAGAMGIDTLGMTPCRGRALFVGAEDEGDEFHRRLADIAAAHRAGLADLGDLRVLALADQDALLAVPDRAGNMVATPLWHRIAKFVMEWRPTLVAFDTAADLFGGDEIKRAQVRQFVAMLRRLAIDADCAVLLLAHPSVAGMTSGTGISGSTAWNNSVRSRLYLKSGEGDLRVLRTMKANYGKTGDEITLRWQAGAFVLHDPTKPGPADALLAGRAERVFIDVLSKLNRTGQRVSPNRSPAYAPKVIARHPDAAGVKLRDLETVMQNLLAAGTIKVVKEGPPSRQYSRLVVSAEAFGGPEEG